MKTFCVNLIILILLFPLQRLQSQDISSISKTKPFEFSGSLYLGGNSYSNFNNEPLRQSPYSYSIIGSPVVTIYGISLPFTFAFNDQQYSFSQPFNIYGVSPSYKWAKLHLGYRQMNFSSFTMSGKQFYGSGIELTPGKFRFSALYGKLRDLYAQKDTLTFGTNILDTYDRLINGVKIGYGNKNSFDFMYIKVKDKENTSTVKLADNKYLLPEDNFVLGLNTKFTIYKYFQLYFETAASLHTSNLQADIDIEDDNIIELTNNFEKIIKVNASTRWGFSGKTGIKFDYKNIGLGFNYLRIDPFFKSLGLYYMNTDYENYTGNLRFSLLKKRLRFKFTAGFQQNNLSQLKQKTDLRKIGSLNISYFTQNGLSIIANYNNYQTDQKAGYIQVEDSLRLALVNQMAFLTPSYSWKKDKLAHSISLNLSYQKFEDVSKNQKLSLIDNQNYTISFDYSLSHTPTNINFNIGTNYFILTDGIEENNQFGASLGVSKIMLNKKLNLRIISSWNKNTYNGDSDGYSLNLRNNINFRITKKQNLSFNIIWQNRTGIHRRNINELRSSLNYGLSF